MNAGPDGVNSREMPMGHGYPEKENERRVMMRGQEQVRDRLVNIGQRISSFMFRRHTQKKLQSSVNLQI